MEGIRVWVAHYFPTRSISTVASAQFTARLASVNLCSTGMRSSKANTTTPWAKRCRSLPHRRNDEGERVQVFRFSHFGDGFVFRPISLKCQAYQW
jgi:hypothetical protein